MISLLTLLFLSLPPPLRAHQGEQKTGLGGHRSQPYPLARLLPLQICFDIHGLPVFGGHSFEIVFFISRG